VQTARTSVYPTGTSRFAAASRKAVFSCESSLFEFSRESCTIAAPMSCPRCQFEQPDGSPECARCGIVFSRWEELHAAAGSENVFRPQLASATSAASSAEELKGWPWWKDLVLPADESDVEPVYFWGRALLAAFLFCWGWRFLLSSVKDDYVDRTGRDAPGYHDWENILGALNLLRYDTALGNLSYAFGRGLMLVAFAWGGWSLAQQRRHLQPAVSAEGFERKNL
jgi:hypothetical protein